MTMSFSFCRKIIIATVTCVVILAVGWWGVWSIAAAQYRHVLEGWVDAGRRAGYVITYDGSELFGFPRHIVLRFKNVSWKNTDNILFHVGDIDIAALPWRWQSFDAKFKHNAAIEAPIDGAESLILGGDTGRAHIDLDPQGYWQRSRIELHNAKIGKSPNYIVTAENLNLSAERPARMPKDHTEAGLMLTGGAHTVELPSSIGTPFGNHLSRLEIDLNVMGNVPDFRRKESVAAWNKDFGVIEFSKLELNWGPVNLVAKGALGFDDDLQPEGAFVGSMNNHAEVMKALLDNGFIAQRQETMMTSALNLFAKPTRFNNNPAIELPMTVQMGGLYLGPVKIFSFPQVDWQPPDAATPAATPAAAP